MSFDLLCRLSGLGLIRGLFELKFEKNLVCASYHHGKMVATSNPPINLVMTKHHVICFISIQLILLGFIWRVEVVCSCDRG